MGVYQSAAENTSKKYKIKSKDVTSADVKKWFEESERFKKRKSVIQREERIINVYLDIKNK